MSRRHVLLADSLASLFARLEELVLANSGEDGFEEIFKLLLAKLWDERSGGTRFTARGIDPLLRELGKAWPGLIAPGETSRLAADHRRTCVEVLRTVDLLEAGGEALDATFEFLTSGTSKGEKGQFFTPRHVVDFCVRMVQPRAGESVADPACGSGAFLVHALAAAPGAAVRGFDFDPRAVRIAKAMLLISGGDPAHVVRLNSLGGDGAAIEDTHGAFDVILTNPPFAGEIREPELLARYALGKGRRRVERDVLFAERCVRLLKPGGRLGIVLPVNKFGADSHAALRAWLFAELRVLAVIGLGRNTFQPHTGQKACILFGQKRAAAGAGAARPPTRGSERIFFGVSEKDGKDAKGNPVLRRGPGAGSGLGWRRVDHDLDELHTAFTAFQRAEAPSWGS